MAASPGFEPRLTESESAVLPLDDEAIYTDTRVYIPTQNKMQTLFYEKNKKHQLIKNNRKSLGK